MTSPKPNPAARHPAYAAEPEQAPDLRRFDPEQQDGMLAKLQTEAWRDWKEATTITERSSAKVAIAQLAQARMALLEPIVEIRRSRRRDEEARQQEAAFWASHP